MSDKGRLVPDHFVNRENVGWDRHVMVPRRLIVWVCSALLTVCVGLVSFGIWLNQRDATTETANTNKTSIKKLADRMTINEQTDKTQDAELNRLSAQVEQISAKQSINSMHLSKIEGLLQQLNERLKEFNNRIDNGNFGKNRFPKHIPRNHNVADNRRVRQWNQ